MWRESLELLRDQFREVAIKRPNLHCVRIGGIEMENALPSDPILSDLLNRFSEEWGESPGMVSNIEGMTFYHGDKALYEEFRKLEDLADPVVREYVRRYPGVIPWRRFYPSWEQAVFAIGHKHIAGSSFRVSYSIWGPHFGTLSSHRRFDQLRPDTKAHFEAKAAGKPPIPPPWYFERIDEDVFTASVNTANSMLRIAMESEVQVYVVPGQTLPRAEVGGPPSATRTAAAASANSVRDSIFVSYSHRDRSYLNQLKEMLRPIERRGNLLLWDDSRLIAGQDWRKEIKVAIARAKVAVLLVSRHFLASEFIANNELPPLLQAAEAEGLTVFWIAVSPCLYKETAIEKYQAAHDPDRPLIRLRGYQREETLRRICEALIKSI